jgi:hypothetical protein
MVDRGRFQVVPEKKSVKNRIHIDVNASGGRGSSLDHYAVSLTEPEGNEFDIN